MKIFAFDIGDKWTGVAVSDPDGLFARPYTTIETEGLFLFIESELQKDPVKMMVVGYPQTLRGTESEQTKKTKALVLELEQRFSNVEWILWDERLTSKYAQTISHKKTNKSVQQQKEEKLKEHARAAAFILMNFLDRLRFQKEIEEGT